MAGKQGSVGERLKGRLAGNRSAFSEMQAISITRRLHCARVPHRSVIAAASAISAEKTASPCKSPGRAIIAPSAIPAIHHLFTTLFR